MLDISKGVTSLLLILLFTQIKKVTSLSFNSDEGCDWSRPRWVFGSCYLVITFISTHNLVVASSKGDIPSLHPPPLPSPPLSSPPPNGRSGDVVTSSSPSSSRGRSHSTSSTTTTTSPYTPPVLPIWSNWYFWLLVALLVLSCMAGCGYWRRRKIYESSASQTLSHTHALFPPAATPSDDTPLFGPPLPFLPPAPYPAPPPYCEATRPSYDHLDHRHLYDALLSGRSVYDFYDRRHPNAYYDRYFLPDDTSSSETTSLLSYRLHRSCSAHLPRHHNSRKCSDLPPPYSEVAAKPELYPVVVVRGSNTGTRTGSSRCSHDIKSTKSMIESNIPLHQQPWLHTCHYYSTRSGSISTPEGSQGSSATGGGAPVQSVCEWWRGRGRVSPGGLLTSCSALPSPASSPGGPLPSDVSSLAPTSPPSPPAPTSPTLPRGAPSPSSREFRDVLHKISQLPGACTPSSPGGLSMDGGSPGGLLSPVALTPGMSPPGNSTGLLGPAPPRCCSRGSQTSWSPSPVSSESPRPGVSTSMQGHHNHPPRYSRSSSHRPLVASLSLEGGGPSRPRSLPLPSINGVNMISSTSTPNLNRGEWMEPPEEQTRADIIATLSSSSRVVHSTRRQQRGPSQGRWWHDHVTGNHV